MQADARDWTLAKESDPRWVIATDHWETADGGFVLVDTRFVGFDMRRREEGRLIECAVDERVCVVRVNDEWTRTFGYAADEIVGQPHSVLRQGLQDHPETHAMVTMPVISGRVPRADFETDLRSRSGEVRWWHITLLANGGHGAIVQYRPPHQTVREEWVHGSRPALWATATFFYPPEDHAIPEMLAPQTYASRAAALWGHQRLVRLMNPGSATDARGNGHR